jgi:hypothetical protein
MAVESKEKGENDNFLYKDRPYLLGDGKERPEVMLNEKGMFRVSR